MKKKCNFYNQRKYRIMKDSLIEISNIHQIITIILHQNRLTLCLHAWLFVNYFLMSMQRGWRSHATSRAFARQANWRKSWRACKSCLLKSLLKSSFRDYLHLWNGRSSSDKSSSSVNSLVRETRFGSRNICIYIYFFLSF